MLEAERYYGRARIWAASQEAYAELALALAGEAAVARIRDNESSARVLLARALQLLRKHHLTETLLPSADLEGSDGPGESHRDLSERELEVLELVSAGLTNRQIAQRLQISHHTVSRHVSNVLEKTGASNRAAAALFLARQ